MWDDDELETIEEPDDIIEEGNPELDRLGGGGGGGAKLRPDALGVELPCELKARPDDDEDDDDDAGVSAKLAFMLLLADGGIETVAAFRRAAIEAFTNRCKAATSLDSAVPAGPPPCGDACRTADNALATPWTKTLIFCSIIV